ncbi:MAG: hypothetical protein ACRDDY_03740 [Clostridium sp.]|uniref:hypothetical protein n=1 Tax=Clostridium sp. TaxID=1506 RepID=UPI003EE58ABE
MKLFQRRIDMLGYAKLTHGDDIRVYTNYNLITDEYKGYVIYVDGKNEEDRIKEVCAVRHHEISREGAKKVINLHKDTIGMVESILESDNNGGVDLVWQEMYGTGIWDMTNRDVVKWIKGALRDKDNNKFYLNEYGITVINLKGKFVYDIIFKFEL